MKFASFSLLFLTASFVGAKEDGLQQQLQEHERYHHKLSGGIRSSAVRKEGKKNTRGGLVSGEGKRNNNSNNDNSNRHYYNYNVDKDAIVDVGILSLNSDKHKSNDNDTNLDRFLLTCTDCCVGDDACKYVYGEIGNGSCNGADACFYAGYYGPVTIGQNSCNGFVACKTLAYGPDNEFSVNVGDGSCSGEYSCFYQGYYGDVTIGDGSCIGYSSCDVLNPAVTDDILGDPIIIGNNACTCDGCCLNILPGSIVGDNECTSLEDGCAETLVVASSPAPSEMPTPGASTVSSPAPSEIPSPAPSKVASSAPSQMPPPSSAPSQMPSPALSEMTTSAPSQMPSAADCGDFTCDSNPNLVEVCIAGRGRSEPSTQCVPKRAAMPLLKGNDESKCGPCDA